MAVATKNHRIIVASTATVAGASGTINISSALGIAIYVRVTNGATPPTTGCLVSVSVSGNGVDWLLHDSWRAGVAANAVDEWGFDNIPDEALHVKVDFGTTDQAVTVQADGLELTSIS